MPFRSGWRCSHLWYCIGGFFSGGWASFIIASVPGLSGRRSCAKGSSRSGGRQRRSSGCGTTHPSRKHPGDRTTSPVRSSCRRLASSRSTSESSKAVRVESPPPTAGCSLAGGTPSVSRPASTGHRSPLSGIRGLPLLRTGHAQALGLSVPLLWVWSTSTTLAPFRPWTSTGMFLFGQSWPSSRTFIAWRHRQASPLLVAGLLLHRSMGFCRRLFQLFTCHLPHCYSHFLMTRI